MTCSRPPALSDKQLLAWSDGEASRKVAEHLQQCAYCRTRGEQLAHQQAQLTAQLYRVACPPSLELGEYHLGVLAPERVAAVEKHLVECLHCQREMADLQGYLNLLASELEPAPQWNKVVAAASSAIRMPAIRMPDIRMPDISVPPIRILVAKLVDHLSGLGVGGGPTPMFAALRGESEEHKPQLVYEVEDLQIIIELQSEPTQPKRRVLLGLILGLEADEIVEAHLEQAGQAPLTAAVDELGNFIFDQLAPGSYTLLLCSPERKIRIEALNV